MKRWYAVQTRPRKEPLAEWHLHNQDFVTFCPCARRARRVGRRMQSVLAPFFPGYIFVALDTQRQRWRSINGTIGVVRLVCCGASPDSPPAALPHGLVERLQELSTPDGELSFDERLVPGDRVRIAGGPFDALCGILERAGEADRVTILLEILSRKTRVEMDRGRLIAA